MIMRPLALLVGTAALSAIGILAAPCPADDDPAPAPATSAPTQEELDAWWADLYGDDPAATRAALKMYRYPEASVPYLAQKLKPLRLRPESCRELLEDLGSDDEATWQAARETLDYLDPRLAIELPDLMEEVTDAEARTRMVELMSDRPTGSLTGKEVSIRKVGGDGFNFFDGQGSWWAEHKVERLNKSSWDRKRSWTRADRGVAILGEVGSPAAVVALRRMATGHPDASPTRAAVAALARIDGSKGDK